MADARQRTLVSVRATCSLQSSSTKVFARSASAEFGVPFSFDRDTPGLTGAERLLGLLSADLTGLFSKICRQQRLAVDRIEVTARAELHDSLRYLGVIGASGTPHYRNFQIKMFVDSPASPADLERVWQETTQRAPLLNTLKPATDIEIEMVTVN